MPFRTSFLKITFLFPALSFCSLGFAQDPLDASSDEDAETSTSVKDVEKPAKGKPSKKTRPGTEKKNGQDQNSDATEETPITSGIEIFAPRTLEMSFGMRFFANDNYCTKLHATTPFPLSWPEQKVRVINSEFPANVAWFFRDLPEGKKQSALARQLVMDIPSLNPNDELSLVVHVEIEKSFINPPADTSVFKIPAKVPAEMNWFMKKSPYIDIDLAEVKRVAKQIASENPDNAWDHVEKIYDWVRDNIKYQTGAIREIKAALKEKQGDCEEMTGIFVAICRASKIPARCVWIPEHCYPEFYLEDPQGEGHWFPCQVAGDRQFGQMHDYRPILQKGDKFIVPEKQGPVRYIDDFFTCSQRAARPGLNPSVQQVLDMGPLKEEIAELQRQSGQQPSPPDVEVTPEPDK